MNQKEYIKEGRVDRILNDTEFIDYARVEPNGYFDYGYIKFQNGVNVNACVEIRSFNDKIIRLISQIQNPINVGDKYSIVVGCDKKFETCMEKFNNAINFRAEPHIPQAEKLSLW